MSKNDKSFKEESVRLALGSTQSNPKLHENLV
jgi:hypothetical protein